MVCVYFNKTYDKFLFIVVLFVVNSLFEVVIAQPYPNDTGIICPRGTLNNGNNCELCPLGSYPVDHDGSGLNAFECKYCPKGYGGFRYGLGDSYPCGRCGYGEYSRRYSSGIQVCKKCPKNTFSVYKGSIRCKPCPAGWVSRAGSTECAICPPGYFLDSKNLCKRCPFGTESTIVNARECVPCRPGTYRNFRTPTCLPCNPGYFASMSGSMRCKFCPIKTYQNLRGQTSCNSCPKFTKAGGRNSTRCFASCSDTGNCNNCEKGMGLNSSTEKCAKCPPGMVSPSIRVTGCEHCPGILIPNKVQTDCICPPNSYFPYPGASCELCPDGASPNKKRDACVCRNGKVTRVVTYRVQICVCPAGQKEVGGKCVPCSISSTNSTAICEVCGPHNGLDRATGSCKPCPGGTENLGYTTGECVKCTGGRKLPFCNCPEGQVPEHAEGDCTKCPAGFYSAFDECRECSGDKYQPLSG